MIARQHQAPLLTAHYHLTLLKRECRSYLIVAIKIPIGDSYVIGYHRSIKLIAKG